MRILFPLLFLCSSLLPCRGSQLRDSTELNHSVSTAFRDADRLLEAAACILGDEVIPPDFPGPELDGIDDRGTDTLLIAALRRFREDIGSGAPHDSLRSSFRRFFFALHHSYEGLFRPAVLGHAGPKLLFFTASVTCDCTRRLSDTYTRQLVQAKGILGGLPPTLVIDCATDPSSMDRYRIDNLPTVLLLDGQNRENFRFHTSEFILPLLIEHLQPAGGDK